MQATKSFSYYQLSPYPQTPAFRVEVRFVGPFPSQVLDVEERLA